MGSRNNRRFEVRWINGEEIDLYITEHMDIASVFSAIADVVNWPVNYLSLVIGHRHFEYIHRIAWRDRTTLMALREECLANNTIRRAEDAKLTIQVVSRGPPDMFWRGCICDFPGHGCCITGRIDDLKPQCQQSLQWGEESHWGCWWCGEDGCCRTGACGHACCELNCPSLSSASDNDRPPLKQQRH